VVLAIGHCEGKDAPFRNEALGEAEGVAGGQQQQQQRSSSPFPAVLRATLVPSCCVPARDCFGHFVASQ
jgi:hypothetical protein